MARSTATITLFVFLCLLVLTTINVSVTGENTSLTEMKEEGHLDAAASRLRRGTASGGGAGAGAGAAGGGASGGGSGSTGTAGTRGYKNKVPRKNGASAAFAPSALLLLGSLFLYFEGSVFSLLSS